VTRILVSLPADLHELLRELAVRKRTSMSKLILAAIEDTYEDEIDAIAGERGLAEHLADPSSSISWEELKSRLRAKMGAKPSARSKNGVKPKARKKSGVHA
jgi:hypothetical protein